MACPCFGKKSRTDDRTDNNSPGAPGAGPSSPNRTGSAVQGAITNDLHTEQRSSFKSNQGLSPNKSMSGLQKNPTAVMARAHDTTIRLEDEYALEKKQVLGTGFCGSVFTAKNKVTGETVAVKSLKKSDAGDGEETAEEVLTRVRSECEIYLNCDHPNITRLRDMYETETHIYLVCDCCTGGELYDRLLKLGQYLETDAAKAMKGMLLAVSYIHNTLNIVHRDLKLQNWLYPAPDAPNESIKLIDFGFSKLLESKKPLMAVTAGTVEYLAPELLFHESQVRYPGDIWAMGVILFMLLGGYPPFSGKNNKEIIAAIRANEIKWFKSRFDKVSNEGKSLILGLLEPSPEKRLTALQALQHPWIKDLATREGGDQMLDAETLTALSDFAQKSAFQKATAMIMAQCMSAEEIRKLEQIFTSLDKTCEGSIQYWELKEALQKSVETGGSDGGKLVRHETGELQDDYLQQVFHGLDFNDDQRVYFSDFVTAVVCKKIDAGSDKLIKATFDRFDVDNSGEISLQNLRNLFGEEFRNVKVEEMMKEVDVDGNMLISYSEFVDFLKQKNKLGSPTNTTANTNQVKPEL